MNDLLHWPALPLHRSPAKRQCQGSGEAYKKGGWLKGVRGASAEPKTQGQPIGDRRLLLVTSKLSGWLLPVSRVWKPAGSVPGRQPLTPRPTCPWRRCRETLMVRCLQASEGSEVIWYALLLF